MTLLLSQLRIASPFWLGLFLLLPLVAWHARRSLVSFGRTQRILSIALRMAVVTTLTLALADIQEFRTSDEHFVVLAVDCSGSIDEAARLQAAAFVEKAVSGADGHRFAVIPFAGRVGPVGEEIGTPSAEWQLDASNPTAVLRRAGAEIPADYVGHVVLLSDGHETTGDLAAAARASRMPVSVVPLAGPKDEVSIASVRATPAPGVGQMFVVEVVVRSDHDDQGTLELRRGGQTVFRDTVKVAQGETHFRFRQRIDDENETIVAFTAEIKVADPNDVHPENNTGGDVVFPVGKPRVLVVDSQPRLASHLEKALGAENIAVDRCTPAQTPADFASLRQYDLVVLSNVPATALSPGKMNAFRQYVGDFGGGLIVVGGDQAFALGGYRETVLEELLPVWCDFKKKKKRPKLALVLVIDQSKSMTGQKIELAREAARRAIGVLSAEDQLGVIAFEDDSRWIVEIQPCGDKDELLQRVETIDTHGGTNVFPAMEKAYLALREAFAENKHVIVLTDGDSIPGDFRELVGEMAASGITVSTVAMGREAGRGLLEDIAKLGGGHPYFCADPKLVPQIFARDTLRASKAGINEEPFSPQLIDAQWALSGVDMAGAPRLLGYVETRAKPGSRLVLQTEAGDPLLAWWRYGQGMTMVFTSDIQDRWAAAWLRWPGFNPFWAQLVRHAMRRERGDQFLTRLRQDGDRTHVAVEAVDPEGRFLNRARVKLTLVDPSGETAEKELTHVAPGRYAIELDTAMPGTYFLELALEHQGRVVYRQRRAVVVSFGEEFHGRPTNAELLRLVAEVSRGTYDIQPTDVFATPDETVSTWQPLFAYLLMIAVLLFAVDVAVRRVNLARWCAP